MIYLIFYVTLFFLLSCWKVFMEVNNNICLDEEIILLRYNLHFAAQLL